MVSATTALAILIACLALAGCSKASSHHSLLHPGAPSTSVVAWLNRAVTTTTTTTTTIAASPPGTPCRAADLRATPGRGGAGLSNDLTVVVLTNISRAACGVGGYPRLIGVKAAGATVALNASHGTYFGDLTPAVLPPGGQAKLYLGTYTACSALNQPDQAAVQANSAANTYTGVVIELPADLGSVQANDIQFDTACGLSVSQLGVELPPPTPTSGATGGLASLTARASLPTQVRAGTTLNYVVVLSNTGSTAISFGRCPSYTEVFNDNADVVTSSYRLNCGPVGAIPAGSSVAFAMELAVPAGAVASGAKIGWELNEPSGPFAGGAIQVIS